MQTCTWRVVIVLLLVGIATVNGWAAHIFGGDFSMTALATQGRYQLVLNV